MTITDGHRRHLERGRRFWDRAARWDRKDGRVARLQEGQWRGAVRSLGIGEGDAVLDVGCGTGHAFAILREAVGETGRVVGIDDSPRMLAAAADRVAEHGWDNVEVRRVDATTGGVEPGAYDAAVAATSLGAVPDVDAAVAFVHDALRPGAGVFVTDMAFGPRPDIQLLRAFYRRVMTGNGEDVDAAVARRFAVVEQALDENGEPVPRRTPGQNWPAYTCFVARRAG